MRKKAKVDTNHPEIVAAFRRLGYTVFSMAQLGNGKPDICCGKFGFTFLFEIKDGMKSLSRRKLTEAEDEFFQSWLGHVAEIHSIDDVIAFDKKRRRTP